MSNIKVSCKVRIREDCHSLSIYVFSFDKDDFFLSFESQKVTC